MNDGGSAWIRIQLYASAAERMAVPRNNYRIILHELSMGNPPRIWLDYRPVRIGWVVAEHDLGQLTAAASLNTCLWGGHFNPIIPMDDRGLSDKLIRLFGID